MYVHAVRIADWSKHPYWRLGTWLRFKPAVIEDNHGPGGFASYEPCLNATDATFTTREGAAAIVTFMNDHYPGVACEIHTFALIEA